MCEVLAAGETLGTGSSAHGALWGVCAVIGEPMQFSLQVRCPRSQHTCMHYRSAVACAVCTVIGEPMHFSSHARHL